MDNSGNGIEALFAEAIRQPTVELREAYLNGACAGDRAHEDTCRAAGMYPASRHRCIPFHA